MLLLLSISFGIYLVHALIVSFFLNSDQFLEVALVELLDFPQNALNSHLLVPNQEPGVRIIGINPLVHSVLDLVQFLNHFIFKIHYLVLDRVSRTFAAA